MRESRCLTCPTEPQQGGFPSSLARTWTNSPITPTSFPPQTAVTIGNWTRTPGTGWGNMTWEGTGGAMELKTVIAVAANQYEKGIVGGTDVDSGTEYTINFTIQENTTGTMVAKVIKYTNKAHTSYNTLASRSVTGVGGSFSLNFTATGDSVWLWVGNAFNTSIAANKLFRLSNAQMYKYVWTVDQLANATILEHELNPYRFAYNGQERIDEKAGLANHYTAPYWEYDPRKAIRENRDPVVNYSFSPYAVFGNNPIWYNDLLGDDFTVGSSGKKDISAIAGNYSGAILYDKKGKASINFDILKNDKRFKGADGKFDQTKLDAFKKEAESDKGFSMVKGLIEAKESYYYGAETKGLLEYSVDGGNSWAKGRFEISLKPSMIKDLNTNPNDLFSEYGRNLSTTSRGDGASLETRPLGYDGAVFIAPAKFYLTKPKIQLQRASVVYHELMENYLRTTAKYKWQDAHDMSSKVEERSFGNPQPGTVQKVVGE